MKSNLLSVKRLATKGFVVTFDEEGAKISRSGTIDAVAEVKRGLFVIKQYRKSASLVTSAGECVHAWHRRFGQRDCDAVMKLKNLVQGVDVKGCNCKEICEACIQGKMQRKPFPEASESTTSEVMELVHTDICGPMRAKTIGGRRYFLTFVDDYSKYTVVYILRKKSDAFDKLQEYVEMARTQFNKIPKILRSDNRLSNHWKQSCDRTSKSVASVMFSGIWASK